MKRIVRKKEQSVRIQTSILNEIEKRVLIAIAKRLPAWMTSDMLTAIGFLGSVIICTGFILSNFNLNWLWLTIFGLGVNWFGDSLDGTLARVRNTQRPIYGFYIDHSMDAINEALMFLGAGLSPLFDFRWAALCYALYMALSSSVYINTHLRNEFRLTYASLGPTEFRLIVVFLCLGYLYVEPLRVHLNTIYVFETGLKFGIYDYVAIFICFILALMYLVTFIFDARYYSKLDPKKKHAEKQ